MQEPLDTRPCEPNRRRRESEPFHHAVVPIGEKSFPYGLSRLRARRGMREHRIAGKRLFQGRSSCVYLASLRNIKSHRSVGKDERDPQVVREPRNACALEPPKIRDGHVGRAVRGRIRTVVAGRSKHPVSVEQPFPGFDQPTSLLNATVIARRSLTMPPASIFRSVAVRNHPATQPPFEKPEMSSEQARGRHAVADKVSSQQPPPPPSRRMRCARRPLGKAYP